MTEQELNAEGMWVSGIEGDMRYLLSLNIKEQLFHALYCGPVNANQSIQSEEEEE